MFEILFSKVAVTSCSSVPQAHRPFRKISLRMTRSFRTCYLEEGKEGNASLGSHQGGEKMGLFLLLKPSRGLKNSGWRQEWMLLLKGFLSLVSLSFSKASFPHLENE